MFAFPLLKPIDKRGRNGAQAAAIDQPVNTASFIPFGNGYRGGISLATGWLAGALGGAKRIVVSQLADIGSVKLFSSGSALDGGPSVYLQPPFAPRPRRPIPRDRRFQAIRGVCRHAGGHHQHDDGRRSAGERCCGGRHGRKRAQIRVRPTERRGDDAASRASRPGLVRKSVAARHPRRRLALLSNARVGGACRDSARARAKGAHACECAHAARFRPIPRRGHAGDAHHGCARASASRECECDDVHGAR